ELPFSANYQCRQSVAPISAVQCHISVPVSAAYQCLSVPPICAHQCHLTVPISAIPVSAAAYQCPSVPPISAIYECCLSVPISDACQCPPVM
ncbi:unnamed protein product, partial [Staurois parvus]